MDAEQLAAVVRLAANLQLAVEQLQAENTALRARVAELEAAAVENEQRRECQGHG